MPDADERRDATPANLGSDRQAERMDDVTSRRPDVIIANAVDAAAITPALRHWALVVKTTSGVAAGEDGAADTFLAPEQATADNVAEFEPEW